MNCDIMYWVEEVDLQSSYMMLLEEPLSTRRIVVGMGERWEKGKSEFQVFLVLYQALLWLRKILEVDFESVDLQKSHQQ